MNKKQHSKDGPEFFALGGVLLFLGDMFIILLFVLLGRLEHAMEVSLPSILFTALPFMISWMVVGGSMGAFHYISVKSFKAVFMKTTVAWLIAGLLGLALRGIIMQSIPALPFVLVTLGLILVLLLVWRFSFSFFFVKMKGRK
jgi:hypothetical protein